MNRKELVICVSGGMDSYIAYRYALNEKGYKPEEILAVNFDIGQPYREKEQKAMSAFGFDIRTVKVDLIRPEFGNVPDPKNYIIPARNLIFATIAAGFGKRVWIMGMKYENHAQMLDKNEAFFTAASSILTQTIGEPTVVESPFIEMSKTDSIHWALAHDITGADLMKTTSCYDPVIWNCGKCSLCFKRWVAMRAAGIDEPFASNPWESEEAIRLVKAYRDALAIGDFSHYQEERIRETLSVVDGLI